MDTNEIGGGALVAGFLVVLLVLYRNPVGGSTAATDGVAAIVFFVVLPVVGLLAGMYAYADGPYSVVPLFLLGSYLGMLEYKCEREGTHFISVNPRGTTKKCASCGVSTEKLLWVREHSCPACGFEADRDANAAWNILSRGITKQLGAGRSESTSSESQSDSDVRTRALLSSTPVETALPVDTPVSAKRVVETGSPITRSQRLLISSQNSKSSEDTLKREPSGQR